MSFGSSRIHKTEGGDILTFEDGAAINMRGDLNIGTTGRIVSNGTQAAAIANSTPTTVTSSTITNPVDTPASADVLRDDLVANTIPSIQTNFTNQLSTINADFTALAAKVNLILAALRGAGIIGP